MEYRLLCNVYLIALTFWQNVIKYINGIIIMTSTACVSAPCKLREISAEDCTSVSIFVV